MLAQLWCRITADNGGSSKHAAADEMGRCDDGTMVVAARIMTDRKSARSRLEGNSRQNESFSPMTLRTEVGY